MDGALGRARASAAVDQLGWRHLFAEIAASVAVTSMRHGIEVAAAAAQACGAAADDHLRVDVRPRRVEILLHTPSVNAVTATDVELARAVTEALGGLGLTITAPTGVARPVQGIEVAIDALDIPAVLQFWRAILGYVDEPGSDEAADAIVDPARQGSVDLVPADGRATSAAKSDPCRRLGGARRGAGPAAGGAGGWRHSAH